MGSLGDRLEADVYVQIIDSILDYSKLEASGERSEVGSEYVIFIVC